MTKLSALRTAGDIGAEDLADEQVNAEHIRTALARASLKSYIVALDENRFHAVDYTPPEGSDHG